MVKQCPEDHLPFPRLGVSRGSPKEGKGVIQGWDLRNGKEARPRSTFNTPKTLFI